MSTYVPWYLYTYLFQADLGTPEREDSLLGPLRPLEEGDDIQVGFADFSCSISRIILVAIIFSSFVILYSNKNALSFLSFYVMLKIE